MFKSRSAFVLTLAVAAVTAFPMAVAAQDEAAAPIEGPIWDLVIEDDDAADLSASMTLVDGSASIFGGCNTFFGSYALDGDSLTFGELAGTKVACETAVMEVEDAYVAALGGVAAYDFADGGTLDLLDAAGAQVLAFEEAGVATTDDLAALAIEIKVARAHIQHLRQRVANNDVRAEVRGLETHVSALTKQNIDQRDKAQALRKRVHALETQLASIAEVLGEQGIIPTGDTE